VVSGVKWRHIKSDFRGHHQQLDNTFFDADHELLGEGIQWLWERQQRHSHDHGNNFLYSAEYHYPSAESDDPEWADGVHVGKCIGDNTL
jgi:hypothetical protein